MKKLYINTLILLIASSLFASCNSGSDAYAEVKNTKDIAKLEDFLKENANTQYAQEVMERRDSLVFDSVSKVNTKEAFEFFIQNFNFF